MISLIEALNYRCLQYIRQPLGPFHVLVGPNASGKSTFLDVVGFLSDLVSGGLEEAVYERTQNFVDLLWARRGERFELALEARIPEDRRALLHDPTFDTVRYEVSVGIDPDTKEVVIFTESGLLKISEDGCAEQIEQKLLFPNPRPAPDTITTRTGRKGRTRRLFSKSERGHGNDNFYAEAHGEVDSLAPAFKLGPRRSTLGNLPEDETNYPVSTWLRGFLGDGVDKIVLNSLLIRKPSPPGQKRGFTPDGSNLPWVIETLRKRDPARLAQWIDHVRTALPDLRGIETIERPEDRHRYLRLLYDGGLEVPSWMASDGTLRLLALTLPAYIEDFQGVYLIEEPENGIHPRAVETMCQSLSSVYSGQVLLATHSPVILSIVEPETVLCFAKSPEGATDIVSGRDHPALRDWQQEENLGVLFAGGVLN